MNKSVLIAGAGPVGLSAALSLQSLGATVRIIDKAEGPPTESRAIGINPRSLQIFDKLGLSNRIIEAGTRLNAMTLHRSNRIVASVNLGRLEHKRNFMIALPQSHTVALLSEALEERGVAVEYGVELTDFEQNHTTVTCTLASNDSVIVDRLLGTDGAHSIVRKTLELPFPGAAYENDWHLADVRMTTPYATDEVHINLLKGGLLLMITIGDGLWRIAANLPDVKKRIPEGCTITETVWESSFKISHRQVPTYQDGNVFLAGDAAHIHSPAGGRGMNLGIEDSWTFANLLAQSDEDRYSDLRHPVGQAVVKQTDLMTRIMSARNPGLAFIRDWMFLPLIRIPAIQRAVAYRMTALDRVEAHDRGEGL